jgi:hypothetical protein
VTSFNGNCAKPALFAVLALRDWSVGPPFFSITRKDFSADNRGGVLPYRDGHKAEFIAIRRSTAERIVVVSPA